MPRKVLLLRYYTKKDDFCNFYLPKTVIKKIKDKFPERNSIIDRKFTNADRYDEVLIEFFETNISTFPEIYIDEIRDNLFDTNSYSIVLNRCNAEYILPNSYT